MSDIHAALATLLATDATFVAAMQALNLGALGNAVTPTVLNGNQPFASLGQEKLPAWVIEIGDSTAAAIDEGGDGDGLTIGSTQQGFSTEILVALVWHQQGRETAFTQRTGLLAPMTSLLLRNVVGDSTNCWVERFDNDRQANHPLHVARFTLRALHILSR